MVDSTCAEKTQSNHWGGKIKLLGEHSKIWSEDTQIFSEAKEFDEDNGNTSWWDSILK